MNFEAQILKLRSAANEHAAEAEIHRNDAAIDREKATEILERVKRSERAAIESERLARDFDLLADALGTGRITRERLREIVNVEMLDDEPDAHWADRQWWNGEVRTKDEDRDAERENRDRDERLLAVAEQQDVPPAALDEYEAPQHPNRTRLRRADQQPVPDPEPAAEQPRDIFGRCPVHLLPLDENGVCQFNEDDQHPEKDEDGLLPDPLVMDGDEYYTSIVENSTYTEAQLDGTACIHCEGTFGIGEPNYPVNTVSHGQLFAHTNPDDCKTDAKERAL